MSYRAIPIQPSTNLAAAQYNDDTQDLLITFVRQGRRYVYHDVPIDIVEGLSKAISSGLYFIMHIKDYYEYEPL